MARAKKLKAPSVKVGNQRLLKLASFLRKLPRKRFYYGHWVGDDWGGDPTLSCGTTACALGWATTMPGFRRLGLHLNRDFNPALSGSSEHEQLGRKLFAIDDDEFDYLFIPRDSEYLAPPTYVARKIERFVRQREKDAER